MDPRSHLPLSPANRSYCDEVEAIIRDRGPISTSVLARLVPESPLRRQRRLVLGWGIAHDAPMSMTDLLPYLAALSRDYRIALIDHGAIEWRCVSRPTVVHGLKDPVPTMADDATGDGPTPSDGRQPR